MASKPRLLLDTCCGPDATRALEFFAPDFEPVVFFTASNIHPKSEFLLRLQQVQKVARHFGVQLVVPEYDPRSWFEFVRGFENEPEGGKRCARCFEFRLIKAADAAMDMGIEAVSTTLTVSPHKDVVLINEMGQALCEQRGLKWIRAVLRKADGFKRSVELSKQLGLYRQNYCGCVFSLRESRSGKPRPVLTRNKAG